MEHEIFESELGNVAISRQHVERQRSNSDKWSMILRDFPDSELVDRANFHDIEDIAFEPGEEFPMIKVKRHGEWGEIFFSGEDEAKKCFKKLKYQWNAYQQNH